MKVRMIDYVVGCNFLSCHTLLMTHICTDEYKEHYYAKRPGIEKRDYGDTSERVELRKKLQCKSFDWFLKHVYPELPLPNENLWHGGAVSFSLSLSLSLLSLSLYLSLSLSLSALLSLFLCSPSLPQATYIV